MGVTLTKNHCDMCNGLQCYFQMYLFDKIDIFVWPEHECIATRDVIGCGSSFQITKKTFMEHFSVG